MSRLKEQYQNEIVDALTKKFGYKNIMEVPKLDKIVINMGVGEAVADSKKIRSAVADLAAISGQKLSRYAQAPLTNSSSSRVSVPSTALTCASFQLRPLIRR